MRLEFVLGFSVWDFGDCYCHAADPAIFGNHYVGTAGAQLIPLSSEWCQATRLNNTFMAYLLGTVNLNDGNGESAPGTICFEVNLINRSDLPPQVAKKFSPG
ncbi:MAG: hypothetical protein HYX72_01165 [Acidobacteria bacterium]|nr:hypothetical protein [Acidobacteriota bacterium]